MGGGPLGWLGGRRRDAAVAADSIAMPYSVTKPFAAVCALLLVQEGRLDLDSPIQRYWPEFTADATVRQVISHQAGVVALTEPADTELFYDWSGMCARLAAEAPSWSPGTALGESALFYGHLVGELVRRIDGRTVGTYLRDQVTGPAGLDFHLGLRRDEQARTVELTDPGNALADISMDRTALGRRATANPPGSRDMAVVNSARWRAAEIPAINGHGTARAVAGFYAALLQGEILAADVLAAATRAQCSGVDEVLGAEASWGLGFGVDELGFGMGGLGGSMGWACTTDRYAFAFITGTMSSDHGPAEIVENAARGCLGLEPL